MPHLDRTPIRLARQRGQAGTEYLLITLFIFIILIHGGAASPISELVAAFKSFFSAYSFTLSLP
jgi:phage replication-related protein YjqB (UPF0714/DUF867 family)